MQLLEDSDEDDEECKTYDLIQGFMTKSMLEDPAEKRVEQSKAFEVNDDIDIALLEEALWSELDSFVSNVEKSRKQSKLRKSEEASEGRSSVKRFHFN